MIEAPISELCHPTESREDREAREALRKVEEELVVQVKVIAAKRRALPAA
jgi:predicted dithiol-disulfide oxidoreductase (DUF899 family)